MSKFLFLGGFLEGSGDGMGWGAFISSTVAVRYIQGFLQGRHGDAFLQSVFTAGSCFRSKVGPKKSDLQGISFFRHKPKPMFSKQTIVRSPYTPYSIYLRGTS